MALEHAAEVVRQFFDALVGFCRDTVRAVVEILIEPARRAEMYRRLRSYVPAGLAFFLASVWPRRFLPPIRGCEIIV
jgi:hypothetical protein